MSSVVEVVSASDDEVLAKLQTICQRLGQPSYGVLPKGAPGKVSCVFGCALNGAVESLHVKGSGLGTPEPGSPPYTSVNFWTTSPEAATVIAEELGGVVDDDDYDLVTVPGSTPEMVWMHDFDAGLKPHLVTDDPRVVFGPDRRWDTYL